MEAVTMVLLGEIFSLQNRTRKSELIQTVLITKSYNFIKTITFFTLLPMRRISSHVKFTGLTQPTREYKT